MDDVPLQIYRRQRLLRALGLIERARILPPARSLPAPAMVSQLARPGQYRGDLAVITWNAQAFFASEEHRRGPKLTHLKTLLTRSDAVLITEAHGTVGQHAAWSPPSGTAAWWSPGPSAARAGVGIVVKQTLLNNFTEVAWKVSGLGALPGWSWRVQTASQTQHGANFGICPSMCCTRASSRSAT